MRKSSQEKGNPVQTAYTYSRKIKDIDIEEKENEETQRKRSFFSIEKSLSPL